MTARHDDHANLTDGVPTCGPTRRNGRTDRVLRFGVAFTVACLAIDAGAISFDHMQVLASRHGQVGWQSLAFPISVDGLEIVASLVLLAEHRERGRTSALPWIALAAGTAASIAANLAVGPPDLVGRAVSGWPAVGLIVALKLLTGRLSGPADPRRPAWPGRPILIPALRLGTANVPQPAPALPATHDPAVHHNGQPHPATAQSAEMSADLAVLVAEGCRIRTDLTTRGKRVTRRELVAQLRAAGHTVSNERATEILRHLNSEMPRPANGVTHLHLETNETP